MNIDIIMGKYILKFVHENLIVTVTTFKNILTFFMALKAFVLRYLYWTQSEGSVFIVIN